LKAKIEKRKFKLTNESKTKKINKEYQFPTNLIMMDEIFKK